MSSGTVELSGPRGRLTLRAAGGNLGPFRVRTADGGAADILTSPGWDRHPDADDLIPVLRNLAGDFLCLPYGPPQPMDGLPADWTLGLGPGCPGDEVFHGAPVAARWHIAQTADDAATMRCDLPPPHPVAQIERQVWLTDGGRGYACRLTVEARAAAALPLSLHPCFPLPDAPGALTVEPGQSGQGWTYPVPILPRNAPVAPDRRIDDLAAVPAVAGGPLDFTRLPLDAPAEALVMVPADRGEVRLGYADRGLSVTFRYDAVQLPLLVLWLSDRSRDGAPFDGSFRTVGVEAIAGAFDLGPAVSQGADNPVAREGCRTAIPFVPGTPFVTEYAVSVTEDDPTARF